jgi:large subunit ribosomal protein L30
MASEIRVTLTSSANGRKPQQSKTLEALGLRKMNISRVYKDTPQIRGMVEIVKHLVKVEAG